LAPVVEKAAEHVRRWVQHSGDALCRTGAYRRHEGSIAREGRGIRRIGVEMREGVDV
jgi:purine-nucleoside phosphorylase